MKQYNTFLFDLDGTLTDPEKGITNSIRHALGRLGIKEIDTGNLNDFIGPPLLESFRKWYGLDDARARQAVAYYREYFANKGIFENKIFDGVTTLISQLNARACRLVVATSKPSVYAESILKHFAVRHYFDIVIGSNMDLTRASKHEIIEEVIGITGDLRDSGMMIGDRADDIMAARSYMMDSVAVGYGYGSEIELSRAKPTYVVRTVGELATLLLGLTKK